MHKCFFISSTLHEQNLTISDDQRKPEGLLIHNSYCCEWKAITPMNIEAFNLQAFEKLARMDLKEKILLQEE